LKWWTLKLLWKNFHFWEFFNLGRAPMRNSHLKKKKKKNNFSIFFPPHFSLHSWGSAFPILPPFEFFFERAFEPSSYLHSSAPSSPRFISISEAPLSPRPLKVVHFLSYLLWSASASPHFPSSFYLLNNAPSSPVISYFKKKILVFIHWVGNPLQCDHLGR
jgi:hypothetical protein